jgi:hypothetical protein
MLVSRLEKVKLEEPKHVIEHSKVLSRIFEQHTVLPFRYGTTFGSEEEIRALLLQNREQFVEGLRVLRGKAEVHVKLSFRIRQAAPRTMVATAAAGPTPRITVSSQGYVVAPPLPLAEIAQRQTDVVIDSIKEAFLPIQQLVSVRYADRGQVHLEVRCLVPEDRVDACKKFAASSFEDLEERAIQVTGPWPPCHFLPVSAKLPNRAERMPALPGRLPLRSRAARV